MRVVIVGAGFAGLDCARALAGSRAEVTLVERNNFHTFQPLLYQVATAGLAAADVSHAVRGIVAGVDNVTVRRGVVTGVDWDQRTLELDGDHPALPFDRLVLAAGAVAGFFGVPGAEEHGFPLYSLTDAIRLRNHILERFEAADEDPLLIDRGALTFVVVGGGPTGVEIAGALMELFEMVLRHDFPRLAVHRARVVLVEMADTVLGPFSPQSRRHGVEELRRRGVELRLGQQVASVAADALTLTSGERIDTSTLVWAAGVRANPLADALGVDQTGGGRIVVGDDLRLPGHPEAFAVGDVAAVLGPDGRPLPQLAPVAKQSGAHVGPVLRAEAEGTTSPAPFRYRDRGTMATIGRRAAVADLPLGIRLSGTPAWLAWLGLHLLLLVGFRNRLSVFVNWAWSYLTYDRGPRLIIEASDPPPGGPAPPMPSP
ncbi:MAG TPA: NAD(P)/FAD-dependent oxidoreductase [Acidimicrobiales bacterium]|nr:NAD(P)/FAD-dependent oxidoreductase [Acidimicrobiales bacterium]